MRDTAMTSSGGFLDAAFFYALPVDHALCGNFALPASGTSRHLWHPTHAGAASLARQDSFAGIDAPSWIDRFGVMAPWRRRLRREYLVGKLREFDEQFDAAHRCRMRRVRCRFESIVHEFGRRLQNVRSHRIARTIRTLSTLRLSLICHL